MSRPPFALTDDQARALVNHVTDLQIRFPKVPGASHRPFVRAFIAAVHEATGNLYGASTYRRLLQAYASERTPSTNTLADERRQLEEKLGRAQRAVAAVTDDSGTNLMHLIRAAVNDAMDASLGTSAHFQAGFSAAQAGFLRNRLDEAEATLVEQRAHGAKVRDAVVEAKQAAALHQQQAQEMLLLLDRQAAAIATLTSETQEARRFAMLAIDEARGETRLWKERCAALESERQRDARVMETLRQAAYRSGAAIPPELNSKNPR